MRFPLRLLALAVLIAGALPSGATAKAPSPAARLARDLVALGTRPMPGGRVNLTSRLRRAVPRLARGAGALADRGLGTGAPRARTAAVVREERIAAPDEHVDGLTISGSARAQLLDDKTLRVLMSMQARLPDGRAVRISPEITRFADDAAVGCPTSAGTVTTRTGEKFGGTTLVLDGRRVLAAATIGGGDQAVATGHVGPDARLQSVDVVVTGGAHGAQRGVQWDATTTVTVHVPREGAPVLDGAPVAVAHYRAAGVDSRTERRFADELRRGLAGQASTTANALETADTLRARLLATEPTWYEIPNDCVDLVAAPASIAVVGQGQHVTVSATMVARADGGAATGTLTADEPGRGSLAVIRGALAPGASAQLDAVGAAPDANGLTVDGYLRATSTAGRAAIPWKAKSTLRLPLRFTGDVYGDIAMPTLAQSFIGRATFEQGDVHADPDGTVSARYTLTAASLLSAHEAIGPADGCHHEADGTGGEVRSGDLEVRVAADGSITYALQFDVEIPSVFTPSQSCPPGTPPLSVPILAPINTYDGAAPDGGFRQGPADWQLHADDVPNHAAPPGQGKASWDLTPAF